MASWNLSDERRDLLKFGASAAAAPMALAQQHTQHAAPAAVTQAAWTPQLSTPTRTKTIVALTELIIPATDTPGAKEALVNHHLDKLLHDGPAADQAQFLQGLACWMHRPFAIIGSRSSAVPNRSRIVILTALDAGSGPGHNFFTLAKTLTANIYYATEAASRK